MSLSISRRDARRSALSGLIDYAGLFPPSELEMEAAVAEYRTARTGPHDWMIDRFICPAARLEELVGAMTASMTSGERPWRIAVTASGWLDALSRDAGAVRTFRDTVSSAASVDLVEIRVPTDVAADPERLAIDAAQVLTAYQAMVFFELPWQIDPSLGMDTLAELRDEQGRALGVKIRCGGLDADLFPPPDAVARFVVAAAERALPLKATAGLHHPFRHTDAETGFHHHGFVNVLAATALAHEGEPLDTITAVLADEDPEHFRLDKAGLAWTGHRVGAADLDAMRGDLFTGYGSCSFDEPVEDLTEIGVLPVEVTA